MARIGTSDIEEIMEVNRRAFFRQTLQTAGGVALVLATGESSEAQSTPLSELSYCVFNLSDGSNQWGDIRARPGQLIYLTYAMMTSSGKNITAKFAERNRTGFIGCKGYVTAYNSRAGRPGNVGYEYGFNSGNSTMQIALTMPSRPADGSPYRVYENVVEIQDGNHRPIKLMSMNSRRATYI